MNSGTTMPATSAPVDPESHWDLLLQPRCGLQQPVPGSTLVGGAATALWAAHRYSLDADHVLPDLQERFAEVLAHLEQLEGWTTARVRAPVLILGALDGVDTGLRQLRRTAPLTTTRLTQGRVSIQLPTRAEMLRIKGFLVVTRNATRDFVDYTALAQPLPLTDLHQALAPLDSLYALPGLRAGATEASVLHELGLRLGAPRPQDLDGVQVADFRSPRGNAWAWSSVRTAAIHESVRTMAVHDEMLRQDGLNPRAATSRSGGYAQLGNSEQDGA